MLTTKRKQFNHNCKKVFSTPEGEAILDYLVYLYVDVSCFGKDNNDTNRRIGNREVVEQLIRESGKDLKSVIRKSEENSQQLGEDYYE